MIGSGPEGETGAIVYFGNGDGKLFALSTQTGQRRWSYDTTAAGQALPDRNDLNGSPALGQRGIYICGEHGQLWYVPYDYALHHLHDPRVSVEPSEPLPESITTLYYVSPGGRAQAEIPAKLPAAALICLKLIVRKGRHTLPARFFNSPFFSPADALHIRFDPPLPFRYEVSGDGKYLTIKDFLAPNTEYALSVSGAYCQGSVSIGNLKVGVRSVGKFKRTFTFTTESPEQTRLPLILFDKEVPAFEWTRLAVPIPTMLPSLNQIGFDYMDWLIAPVLISDPDDQGIGQVILWAIGARRNEDGELVADTATDFRLPLSGRYQDDTFIVINRNFKMSIPFTSSSCAGGSAKICGFYPAPLPMRQPKSSPFQPSAFP